MAGTSFRFGLGSPSGAESETAGGMSRRRFPNGRASGIRTHDPLHPMQVRYQTALQPVFHLRMGKTAEHGGSYLLFYSCQYIFFVAR